MTAIVNLDPQSRKCIYFKHYESTETRGHTYSVHVFLVENRQIGLGR